MDLAKHIEHTLLKPGATIADITGLCREAEEYGFVGVCVNPCYVDLAAHLLRGSGVSVATVIGFPLGANLTAVKVAEARMAVSQKAGELDMVIQLSAAKQGVWEAVTEDIRQVVAVREDSIVKVILETALLTDEEKRRACQAAMEAGAQYVKTSTGFVGGATEADIRLMKTIVGDKLGIKAAGGIRTRGQAEAMLAAGAARIGASAGVAIVSGSSA